LTAFEAAAATGPVSLCVGVVPLQQSSQLGQTAQWAVGAWTVGGNLADAKIQLQSTAGAGSPTFSFGCTNGEGTSVCDLGAVYSTSAQREFQAAVSVPLTATTLTAVSLTVTGSAASLAMDPAASASIVVLASASPVGASLAGVSATAPAGVAAPTPAVGAGGSAASLFPTVAPGSPQAEGESPVANVSALHGGTPVGTEVAEGAGLAALAVAMLLAITRLSFRRPAARPGPRHAAGSAVAAAPPAEASAERQNNPV
jgi:hypothetical protein